MFAGTPPSRISTSKKPWLAAPGGLTEGRNRQEAMMTLDPALPRRDWTLEEVEALFDLPFNRAGVPRRPDASALVRSGRGEISRLLSVKTGGCPENCGYCSQSAHFKTGSSPPV